MTRLMAKSPQQVLEELLGLIRPVDSEEVPLALATGRVLAETVRADRDSPAADVSAMDGYAVRLSELLAAGFLPVAGEVRTGSMPPALPAGRAMQIFTGGGVPAGADAVVRREDLLESIDAVRLNAEVSRWKPGLNIRRRGENLQAGDTLLAPGVRLDAPQMGAAALFGRASLPVHRKLRVSILVTGDEVLSSQVEASPWQVRDANGPALRGLLGLAPWIGELRMLQGADVPGDLARTLESLLPDSDAVLLTGGVSMGDHDHVPGALRQAGAQTVFHRLPIRPGKPVLGAVGPQGQPVLGLPGNPVSVLCTAVRFALPALRKKAGQAGEVSPPGVTLAGDAPAPVDLWTFRPVKLEAPGEARLLATRGSGDLAAVSGSDGFVEIPPGETHAGPWPFYSWSVS